MRTSSGSVVSNRLNSSVHENVRRSIRSLACSRVGRRDVDLPRIDARAQLRRLRAQLGRRAPRRATPASPSSVSLRE